MSTKNLYERNEAAGKGSCLQESARPGTVTSAGDCY